MFENQRLAIARAISPKAAPTDKNHLNLASAFTLGVPIYSNMTVRKATREGYKMSIYIYRGIRTIIQAGSGIPWIALDDDGTPLPDHEFTQLMAHPNPEFSGQDLMEFLIAHECLCGNGLWQPMMVNGRPRELWTVMPDLVQPIPSEVPGKWLDGWQVEEGMGNTHIVPPETFIHFMQVDPGNPYWGIGPLMAAARTVDTDNEMLDAQKVMSQNRGMPPGILQMDNTITDDELAEVKLKFKNELLAKNKRGEPWILNHGATWQQMSFSPVEIDYIASRLRNLQNLSAALGLDPWWLGDRSASTYNNVSEARKALYEVNIIPMLDDFKSTMQMKIGDLFGVQIGYDLSNVSALRDDYGKKVVSATSLWNMGVPFDQINSSLELGFQEFDGWDRSYIPFSLMPAGQPATPATDQTIKNKAMQADTEEQKTSLWKRQDTRRQGWWAVVDKKITPLYDDEASAIEKALKGNSGEEMAKAAQSAIQSTGDSWVKVLTVAYTAVIEDIGTQTAVDLGMKPKSAKMQVFDPFSAAAITWIKKQAGSTVKTILDTDIEAVRAIILNGFNEGQGVGAIAKLIRGFYDDNSAWKAARVARTEVGKAAGFGSHEAARQSGVVETKRWLTARDSAVRDSHQALEGESQPLEGTYSNGCSFPCDPSGDPGEVINCILPDNPVRVNELVAASRSFYEGSALELITEKGKRLSVTPNHPILTNRGFILAQHLRPGDNLICDNFQEGMVGVNQNITDIPTTIEQIFSSLLSFSSQSQMVSPTIFDFHGDGRFIDGDIEIVMPDRKLGSTFESPLFQPIGNNSFSMMDIPPISLVGNGAADTFIIGSLHSPDGSMGGIGTDASLTGRHEGHGDNIGLTGISRFNPVCQESSPDHTPVYPELAGQFQLRFASYITFDKLVEIRHIYHSGHVFDLQSIHGLYTCNGVFVKNCRCTELYGF